MRKGALLLSQNFEAIHLFFKALKKTKTIFVNKSLVSLKQSCGLEIAVKSLSFTSPSFLIFLHHNMFSFNSRLHKREPFMADTGVTNYAV